jgi:sugar O-acyltransferase (sialic acid O-acetyltransferase NeuD family)
METEKKLCIFGIGGFGREVLSCYQDSLGEEKKDIASKAIFMVSDAHYAERQIMGVQVIPLSLFEPMLYDVVVAISDPIARKKIVENLPNETTFGKIIHPSVYISKWVNVGEGSIIAAGCIVTVNVKIGKHAQLNLQTTVGHDSIIGDFFTSAPGAKINGNSLIGHSVYVGSNAALRQGINICSEAVIGMGAVVVKNIVEKGVYTGNPATKMERES